MTTPLQGIVARIDSHYDADLIAAYRSGGMDSLAKTRNAVCTCGHIRNDHYASTGALGSFGGSACGECWTCGTFTKAKAPPRLRVYLIA